MQLERSGKYELLERLGHGGMGEVWKARDTQLQRFVAIKLLNADYEDKENFIAHFMHEAQLVASLHHPNIVQIHDFQLMDSPDSSAKAFMVMDYIEGGTLGDYIRSTIRKGIFPPAAEIVHIFTAISLALDYAHQRGMIHRDIKPENILLDKSRSTGRSAGEPILTDFGIARLQGTSGSTLTNAWMGTPHYMSPEQADSRPLDARSDLYSLGIVLYQILTGVTPFRGEGPIAIIVQHMFEKPTPPELINPRIPPALSAVVLQSIAKDPAERFPRASAMTIALAQALNVPVPASLDRTRRISEQPDFNPLQPSRTLSGVQPQAPTLPSPAPFAAPPASGPGHQAISPVPPPALLTPATSDYPEGVQHTPLPQQPRPRRQKMRLALVACCVLLLGGISAFAVVPRFFPSTTPGTSNAVVGTIVFSSSSNQSNIQFDQVQLDLKNIPAPPQSMTYYAWIENANHPEALHPHWQLTISHGNIQQLYRSLPPVNLLANTTTFLITVENASGPTPDVPTFTLSQHRYYAAISPASSSTATFQVKQCPPPTSSGSAGNQWCL